MALLVPPCTTGCLLRVLFLLPRNGAHPGKLQHRWGWMGGVDELWTVRGSYGCHGQQGPIGALCSNASQHREELAQHKTSCLGARHGCVK